MGLGVLGKFGDVIFFCNSYKVLTFKDVQVQRSVKYAQHDVLMQMPEQEFIGYEASTISFQIQLRSLFKSSPDAELLKLRRILESKKEQILMLGENYVGDYILTSYDETNKKYNGFGICIACDVDLQLKEVNPGTGSFIQSMLSPITDTVSSVVSNVVGGAIDATQSVSQKIGSSLSSNIDIFAK